MKEATMGKRSGLVLILVGAFVLAGCNTISRTVDAGKATLDIIGGAAKDVESVWDHSGKKVTDATGITDAPAPSK